MKKIFLNNFFILGLVLIPLLLIEIMVNIFNGEMPQIISGILVFSHLLGLILLLVKLLNYSSAKSGKSMARTFVTIIIKLLIMFIIFFIMCVECGKSISETGFIIPLIK